MILSDTEIIDEVEDGEMNITPLKVENIQPASYDITLGNEFYRFDPQWRVVNPLEDDPRDIVEREVVDEGETFVIEPGEFVLASTDERISLPNDVLARLDGRSSWGRWGLAVHITAGICDPGYSGEVTMEFKNHNHVPLELTPYRRLGQLVFERLSEPADIGYGEKDDAHYQNQSGPQLPRIHE